jgi:superfamily II DNA or RNA helicase
MAEEGLDISGLNVVILCTPKSAIKQSVGRILRKDVYEECPIVIDIIDCDNPIFKAQSNSRNMFYQKQHFNVQNFDVADYKYNDCKRWNDSDFIRQSLTMEPLKKHTIPQHHYTHVTNDMLEIESSSDSN